MPFGRQSDVTRIGWFGSDSGRRPWRLSAKLLIASSIATVIGFSAICTSVMLDMRRPMLRRGAFSVVLSRRITDADGGFLGVVVGSIRFTYFHDLFGRLTLNPGDTITVLRRDRTIIMRMPFDLDVIGKNLAELQKWRANNLKEGTA